MIDKFMIFSSFILYISSFFLMLMFSIVIISKIRRKEKIGVKYMEPQDIED